MPRPDPLDGLAYRVQRFSSAREVTFLDDDGAPPATGWAIGPDGVYENGERIARRHTFQIGSTEVRRFCELRYVPLDAED